MRTERQADEEAREQLAKVINEWRPEMHVDPWGLTLDYAYRSGCSLDEVFRQNFRLYETLMVDGPAISSQDLVESVVREAEELQRLAEVTTLPALATAARSVLERRSPAMSPIDAAEMLATTTENDPTATVIWQLSDLHFGSLMRWAPDPRELASALTYPAATVSGASPDYVVISGDLTSKAEAAEFDSFKEFCRCLQQGLWGENCAQRILAVPGNHDVTWLPNGKADRLAAFVEALKDEASCITPFGPRERVFRDPKVVVHRYGLESPSDPPLALVSLEKERIELLLMTSAYYSGDVPLPLRELITDGSWDRAMSGQIFDLVRRDEGKISMAYLSLLATALPPQEGPRLALVHHPMAGYDSVFPQTPLATATLAALHAQGADVVLHGHLHAVPSTFPGADRLAQSILCTTLTAETWLASRGFLVHVIHGAPQRRLSTYSWSLGQDATFRPEGLRRIHERDLRS